MGFGNSINAMYVTERLIELGAAGMNMRTSSSCRGHLEGKQIVSIDEMALKVRACADVRDRLNADFIINASTDAIASRRRGGHRARERLRGGGTDLIFVEAPQSPEQIQRIVDDRRPVSINLMDAVVGGKTPLVAIDTLREMVWRGSACRLGRCLPRFAACQNYSG